MKNAYLLRQIACESDGKSDYSSITDDGYLVSNEETGTILWQHVKFYIVHNPRFHGMSCRFATWKKLVLRDYYSG
ncbi:hypothetical protein MAP00_000792 [Monascus purpureus]|nr:hypothetical protein MAP00_000792 [Monascus purpureus]